MRQYRLQVRPELDAISSFDAAVVERDGVEPRAFRSLDLLGDGSAIAVYEMRGDPDRLEPVLADADGVRIAEVFNEDGDAFDLYLRFDPEPLGAALLDLLDRHGLVLDTPASFTADGGLVVTVAGPASAFRDALEAVPDGIDLSLATTGEYDPAEHDLASVLTDRQREVVSAAIEAGYYEVPREVTQAELAERFACSPTTVGDHLRKAESRVLSAVFGQP